MFTYQGKQRFVTHEAHGLSPKEEGIGWHWADYNENRHLYVRPLGKDQFQLAIFVRGTRTTDQTTTRRNIQTYAINHLGFQMHDSLFREMEKSL